MKSFLGGLFCLLLAIAPAKVLAQATGDYQSAATGNWNATATWERFDGMSWVAAVATPTSVDGVITIRSPHVVTITATVTYDQVTIDSGGQVTIAATITDHLCMRAPLKLSAGNRDRTNLSTWTSPETHCFALTVE